MNQYGAKAYHRTAVETASKEKILLMLYEAAIRHLKKCQASMEAKNWAETWVPNADACWLMRIITADSACIAILKILFVKFLPRLIYEELQLFRPNL